jgi:hypothetical protein
MWRKFHDNLEDLQIGEENAKLVYLRAAVIPNKHLHCTPYTIGCATVLLLMSQE